jgi:hypothetical protein
MLKLANSDEAFKSGVQVLPSFIFQSFDEVKVAKN